MGEEIKKAIPEGTFANAAGAKQTSPNLLHIQLYTRNLLLQTNF